MNIIGIVGGIGPYAGLDLCDKIMKETLVQSDQDHLPIALLSLPEEIEDRSRFLLGQSNINPAFAVSEVIHKLSRIGATHIGLPCNTMHAPEIFNILTEQIENKGLNVKVVNMIDEVIAYINTNHENINKMGILSTTGTFKKRIYYNALIEKGFIPVRPTEEIQEEIHEAIYNEEIGIKSKSSPITKRAKNTLVNGIRYLKDNGAEGVILGCTEIAYTMPYKKLNDLPLFNTTQILARSLINLTYPEKLKPVG